MDGENLRRRRVLFRGKTRDLIKPSAIVTDSLIDISAHPGHIPVSLEVKRAVIKQVVEC